MPGGDDSNSRPKPVSVVCLGHAVQDFVFSIDTIPDSAGKYRAGGLSLPSEAVRRRRRRSRSLNLAAPLSSFRVLGDDRSADLITHELEAAGVDCTYVRRFSAATSSVSAVLVDADGERMIVNHLDPDLPNEPEWLPDVEKLNARAVLADTRWPAGASRILRRAAVLGLPAVLDADAPVAPAEEALRAATHVAFSTQGLSEYAGSSNYDAALQQVARSTGAWCCVTQGADGVLIADGPRTAHVPAFEVNVVDTLGAGDVWHGAFALALAEGRNATAAVQFASAAAALKCQRSGGRDGVPNRAELESFLKLHTKEFS